MSIECQLINIVFKNLQDQGWKTLENTGHTTSMGTPAYACTITPFNRTRGDKSGAKWLAGIGGLFVARAATNGVYINYITCMTVLLCLTGMVRGGWREAQAFIALTQNQSQIRIAVRYHRSSTESVSAQSSASWRRGLYIAVQHSSTILAWGLQSTIPLYQGVSAPIATDNKLGKANVKSRAKHCTQHRKEKNRTPWVVVLGGTMQYNSILFKSFETIQYFIILH